jgi:hypothetical protein
MVNVAKHWLQRQSALHRTSNARISNGSMFLIVNLIQLSSHSLSDIPPTHRLNDHPTIATILHTHAAVTIWNDFPRITVVTPLIVHYQFTPSNSSRRNTQSKPNTITHASL